MPMFSGASVKSDSSKKSSSKLYWILGGIATLILFGGFLIVASGCRNLFLQFKQ